MVSIFFLYQKRQILYVSSIEQLKLEHANNLLSAQLEIQENTFKNISQEIHDNIGLSLTLAKLNINSIRIDDPKSSQNLLFGSGELISKAINDLSDLSKSFNAEIVTNQGLITSIAMEINRLRQNLNYKVDYQVLGEPIHLEAQNEILLFRIFQESINNILKHAFASQLTVELHYKEIEFSLIISDNGKGFDKERILATKKNQAGLTNILKRASMMQAVAKINSNIGLGTNIEIILPLKSSTQCHLLLN
jgi:two-component system NarL family sensor kinase